MKKVKYILLFALSMVGLFVVSQQKNQTTSKTPIVPTTTSKTAQAPEAKTTKTDTVKAVVLPEESVDSTLLYKGKFKPYKKKAHASYYHDKFHGKRTANGEKYNKNAFTAAHKKLPFGTKLRVTNEANGKSIIVKVNDRGPFVKGREIDLSRKAFMTITSNKSSGQCIVTIEELVK